MHESLNNLKISLEQRKKTKFYRKLQQNTCAIDFTSNDYLGYSRNITIKKEIISDLNKTSHIGSTGSRLLSGNRSEIISLEKKIAVFFD